MSKNAKPKRRTKAVAGASDDVVNATIAKRPEARPKGKRLPLLLGILVILIPVIWFSGLLATSPRRMAQNSLNRSRIDEAEYWLSWARQLSFRDPENALLAARVARYRGDPVELKAELRRATMFGASPEKIEQERILALAQVGQLEEIESDLGTWLVSGEYDAAEISNAYANGLAATGRFEEAMNVLVAWRSDFPNDPRCDFRIGRLEEHVEKYDAAEASYRRSLAIDPEFFPAAFSLGRVMLHQRRVEEALQQFQFCRQMSNPLAAKIESAVALKSLGRSGEARELLQDVLTNDEEEILASYRSVEEQPEGFRAAAEYGRLEADAGNFEDALPWLQAALKVNPLDLTVRYTYGVALRGLGKMQAAEEEFELVRAARERMGAASVLNARVKANPQDLEARFGLGKLILENESERMGLYWLRSILSFDPYHEAAHRELANYYASIIDRDPKNASLARYHRRLADEAQAASEEEQIHDR